MRCSKTLTAVRDTLSLKPRAAGLALLASARLAITLSLARRRKNLQTIAFGLGSWLQLFLPGTRCAVSISFIETFAPISLNKATHIPLVSFADSLRPTLGP